MTKRTRTALFVACLILFLITAPTVILYSSGYRIDWNPAQNGKRIVQTGGLFFKIEPKQASIYLNEKLSKKTDFFFGSALIENLIPKEYDIKISKDGYYSWEKKLTVKEKEVTEGKRIVLIPENLNFNDISKGVEDFWPSPDDKKMVLKESATGTSSRWSLKLYDMERDVKSQLISESEVYSKGADFLSLEWSEDSKEIHLNVAIKEQEKSFVIKPDKSPAVLTPKTITQPPEDTVASKKINNETYYLDSSGNLFRNNEKLNRDPFPVKQETEHILYVFQNDPTFIFLEENGVLYSFNNDSKSFEKFFDGIKGLSISPDQRKLAYFSDSEILILFLKDIADQPSKKAGEKMSLIRLSEKIRDCLWLNSDYVIFAVGDKIRISEIDKRDRINIVDLKEYKEPEIFFNRTNKNLYILSEETLYQSENLIP